MVTTLTTPDTTLAAIEAALPIDPQPYTVGDRPTGLIVVDVVNGFCTIGYGALAPTEPNEQIETMVAETNRLAKAFTAKGWPILAFLDTHEPGKPEPPYPTHCEKGSGEEKLVPQLEWLEKDPHTTLIEKDCINGFIGSIEVDTGNNTLLQWINKNKLEALVVVGICTDICVMDFVVTIVSARNHDLTPTLKDIAVYTEGCSTFDMTPEMVTQLGLPKTAIHPQYISHHVGLYTMAERGAFIASAILLEN
ncbi:MAG: isochorismatase family protein [Symploca sp. SIO2C1]|nr:isochorismatase family protein [Symploca sp. SIO2C1]